MIEGGANPKDVQDQMRYSRIQITLDVYAQFVAAESDRAKDLRSHAHVEPRTMVFGFPGGPAFLTRTSTPPSDQPSLPAGQATKLQTGP